MPKEIAHHDDPGLTLYAKPLPLVVSPWAADAVAVPEDGTRAGYYHADIATPADAYMVFEQAGGSEADDDEAVAGAVIRQDANAVQIADGAITAAKYSGMHRYRQVAADAGNKSADVVIEEAS